VEAGRWTSPCGFQTGLGEIVALEWGDVDIRTQRLNIQRSDWCGHVTVPKGGRSRRLPMTQRLTRALKAARHLRSDRVLCLPDGMSSTRARVIKAIRAAQRVAGLPNAGVHVLRHSFCSHLAMKGAPARGIQERRDTRISPRRSATCS
jgi:integrase